MITQPRPRTPLPGQEPVMSQEQARSSAPGPDLQGAAVFFASVFSETHSGSAVRLPDALAPHNFKTKK